MLSPLEKVLRVEGVGGVCKAGQIGHIDSSKSVQQEKANPGAGDPHPKTCMTGWRPTFHCVQSLTWKSLRILVQAA